MLLGLYFTFMRFPFHTISLSCSCLHFKVWVVSRCFPKHIEVSPSLDTISSSFRCVASICPKWPTAIRSGHRLDPVTPMRCNKFLSVMFPVCFRNLRCKWSSQNLYWSCCLNSTEHTPWLIVTDVYIIFPGLSPQKETWGLWRLSSHEEEASYIYYLFKWGLKSVITHQIFPFTAISHAQTNIFSPNF